MNSLALKITASAGGGAAIIGSGIFAIHELTKLSIHKQLENKNRIVLNTDEPVSGDHLQKTDWEKIITDNNSENTEINSFAEITTEDSDNEAKTKKLRKKCKEILKEKYSGEDQDSYIKAKKYCSKENTELTIKQKLVSENKNILDTDSSETNGTYTDKDKWEQIITTNSNNNAELNSFAGITGDNPSETSEKAKKLREKCKEILKKLASETTNLENAKKYCVENTN